MTGHIIQSVNITNSRLIFLSSSAKGMSVGIGFVFYEELFCHVIG